MARSNRCKEITLSHAVTKLVNSAEWKETGKSSTQAESFIKKKIRHNSIDVSTSGDLKIGKDSEYLARTTDLRHIRLCRYDVPATKRPRSSSRFLGKNTGLVLAGGATLALIGGLIWYKKSKAAA